MSSLLSWSAWRIGVSSSLARRLKSLSLASCLWALALLGLSAILAPPPAFAQNAGRVSGIVKDPTGAVIPGASVALRDEATGTELKTVTDASGFYNIEAIPPRTYTLIVQMQGFSTFTEKGVAVTPAARLELSVTLTIGTQVQEVQVTASATQLMTTTSGAKTDVIGSTQIQNLGTVGRNALELLTLLPGVVNTGFDPTNQGSGFGQGIDSFHVNGLRNDQNDIRMDNAHNMDPGANNGFIIEPNMDMVQELSVKTSNFEADQGRSPFIVDTVTKSGTSNLHGSAYFYGRNAVFNANDWSNNQAALSRPGSKFSYPGFNIGGPVRFPHSDFNKRNDKMFFFLGMEWQRQTPDLGSELATVPTLKMRQGDFTELLGQPTCAGTAGYPNTGHYLNMPCAVKNPTDWGGSAVPGNIIPTSLMPNPAADKAFLNLFPFPNADPKVVDPKFLRYNFAGRPTPPKNRNSQIARVDYSVSENTRLFLRVAHEHEGSSWPFGIWSGENSGWTSNIPEPVPAVANNHSEALSFNVVKILNPTLTNEIQINTQALWFPNKYPDSQVSKISRSALGLNFSGINFGNISSVHPDWVPQINDRWAGVGQGEPGAQRWGGGNLGAQPMGVFANKTEFEFADNLTKVRSTHTLKFGFNFDRTRNDQNLGAVTEGMFTTDTTWGLTTGNEFGDILTEHYKNYAQSTLDNDGLSRFMNVEWYAQDSWKATRRLTLNYGARFAWMQPWNEVRRRAVTFDPNTYVPGQPMLALPGLLLASKFQIGKGAFPSPGINLMPRVGFALDVFGTGKTVLRGGFGIFVQRDQGNVSFNQSNAPPNAFNPGLDACAVGGCEAVNFATAQSANPFGSLGNIGITAEDRFDAHQPQTYEWSFTLAQNIGLKTVLETSYVGNASRHLFAKRDLNAAPLGSMWISGTKLCCANGDSNQNDYRPFKPWGEIDWATHSQTANYNSLQVTARRNVSHGLTVLASYTWSRTLGFSPGFNSNVDPFDTRHNYGLLPYDRAHILNFSYIYQLPNMGAKHFNGNRFAKGLLDDWQLSGITHYTSGQPLRISSGGVSCQVDPTTIPSGGSANPATAGLCQNFIGGDGRSYYGTQAYSVLPLLIANPQNGAGFQGVGTHWLNPAAITLPAIGQFGTFEHPTYRDPSSNNYDLTFFKKFPWGEHRSIEFRWATFNIFNRGQLFDPQLQAKFNFLIPNGDTNLSRGRIALSNPDTFGIINKKTGHRQMEFALKLYF